MAVNGGAAGADIIRQLQALSQFVTASQHTNQVDSRSAVFQVNNPSTVSITQHQPSGTNRPGIAATGHTRTTGSVHSSGERQGVQVAASRPQVTLTTPLPVVSQ